MSFYLRKSVKAGPFRINLSKSGIGVSAGIPGLRIGTGPRGSYVRMGRSGIYYRSTLSRNRSTAPTVNHRPAPHITDTYSPGNVVLSDVTGATSLALLPAQPSDLVTQLNSAAKALLLWPWILGATLIGGIMIPWLLIPGLALTIWLIWRDTVRRTVVLFYEVDGPDQERYQALVDAFDGLAKCRKAWHIVASGAVRTTYQYKVNAGASAIINRQALNQSLSAKPNIKTNIAVPTLHSAGRSVYFLPDRILVKDARTYVDIQYRELRVHNHPERFIENGPTPSDSTQVGTTWKYVNKRGGPDRRFKDNRQLPIMQYGRIDLTTPGGLNILWSFSHVPSAQEFSAALSRLSEQTV